MKAKKSMDSTVKAAWIAFAAAIVGSLIAGVFGVIKLATTYYPLTPTPIPPVQPTPILTPTPTPTSTPTPMWELTIMVDPNGSYSYQQGRYDTSITAQVVNRASDGNTHDLLASAFSLYPVVNGATDYKLPETLVSPDSSTDYQINHNSSIAISLTFSAPCSRKRFTLYLVNSDYPWTYSVTPPTYCSS